MKTEQLEQAAAAAVGLATTTKVWKQNRYKTRQSFIVQWQYIQVFVSRERGQRGGGTNAKAVPPVTRQHKLAVASCGGSRIAHFGMCRPQTTHSPVISSDTAYFGHRPYALCTSFPCVPWWDLWTNRIMHDYVMRYEKSPNSFNHFL